MIVIIKHTALLNLPKHPKTFGERTTIALENQLCNLERRIDDLLAEFEKPGENEVGDSQDEYPKH